MQRDDEVNLGGLNGPFHSFNVTFGVKSGCRDMIASSNCAGELADMGFLQIRRGCQVRKGVECAEGREVRTIGSTT